MRRLRRLVRLEGLAFHGQVPQGHLPLHRLLVPHVRARRRFDAPARQFRGDGTRRHTLKEQVENEPHRLRLFGIDYNLASPRA